LSREWIGFIFLITTIGLYASIGIMSRTTDAVEYYVAGRRVPAMYNGMATGADWMSAASFIGMAGTLYLTGYSGLAFVMGWTGGYCLVALLLAPYLRKFGQFTIPDFLGERYGGNLPRLLGIGAAILCSFTYVVAPFTAIPAIESGFSPTVPVLNDSGQLVRDSFDIALYLEETYRDRPSLFGGDGGKALSRTIEGFTQWVIQPALMRMIVKDIHDCLAPEDQAYFRQSREKRLGKSLELAVEQWEAELSAFPAKLEPLRHTLKFQPFVGGNKPLFADYIVFGAFQWARVVSDKPVLAAGDPVHDWFGRCLDLYDGLGRRAVAA
jgi:glutathione S-transferase